MTLTDFTPKTDAVFVGIDFGGVPHYRLMLPARALKASLFIRTSDLGKMKLVGDTEARVAIYSMPRSSEMLDECQQILALPDRKLILDIDDCLRAVVEDGRHPAVKEWAALLDKHEWLIGRADAVTVTTDFLADYVRSLGQENVHVIPNALDLDRWNVKREPRHKKFTVIGWSGSVGHEGALEAHAPALLDLLERRDDIAFASVGLPLSRYFPQSVRHRFHDVPFVPLRQHPYVLTQFHINIGPTEDTDFYRAKSDLRWLEACASDSYFIGGAHTYPNSMLFSQRQLVLTPEQMVEEIEFAIDNPKWNHDARKKQLYWLRNNRLIEHTAPLWEAAIQSVSP